jgi:hypothetical protein
MKRQTIYSQRRYVVYEQYRVSRDNPKSIKTAREIGRYNDLKEAQAAAQWQEKAYGTQCFVFDGPAQNIEPGERPVSGLPPGWEHDDELRAERPGYTETFGQEQDRERNR